MNINEYIKIAVSLLVVINPLGNIPIYLSMTSSEKPQEMKRISFIICVTIALVLVTAVLFGEGILQFFGISIDAFRVGAGILILLIAISMLHGRMSKSKHTDEEAEEAEKKDSIAVVPLGIPIMAGPGAISTAIVYSNLYGGLVHKVVLAIMVLVIALLTWVLLQASTKVGEVLGKTGINIASRIMGLILAAIAVEFMVEGLMVLFPGLA